MAYVVMAYIIMAFIVEACVVHSVRRGSTSRPTTTTRQRMAIAWWHSDVDVRTCAWLDRVQDPTRLQQRLAKMSLQIRDLFFIFISFGKIREENSFFFQTRGAGCGVQGSLAQHGTIKEMGPPHRLDP